jgi:ankyrin repeat protein
MKSRSVMMLLLFFAVFVSSVLVMLGFSNWKHYRLNQQLVYLLSEEGMNSIRPEHRAKKVMLLIKQGANPNISGPEGRTPLMITACFGTTDQVNELVERGADAKAVDKAGRTVLM